MIKQALHCRLLILLCMLCFVFIVPIMCFIVELAVKTIHSYTFCNLLLFLFICRMVLNCSWLPHRETHNENNFVIYTAIV